MIYLELDNLITAIRRGTVNGSLEAACFVAHQVDQERPGVLFQVILLPNSHLNEFMQGDAYIFMTHGLKESSTQAAGQTIFKDHSFRNIFMTYYRLTCYLIVLCKLISSFPYKFSPKQYFLPYATLWLWERGV